MVLHPLLQTHFALPKTPDPLLAVIYAAFFVAVTLLTMRRPAAGVGVLLAVQPFALYVRFSSTMLTLPKAALIAVLLGLLVFNGLQNPLRERRARRVLLAATLVLFATLLTFAQARYHAPVIRETLKMLEYIVLFCTVYAGYRLDPQRRWIRGAILASVIAVCLLALAQEIVGAPSALLLNGHATPRIAGPLEGPNQLAGYFDVLLPLVMALAIEKSSSITQAALFLIVCTDILTFSRGGLVGAIAGLVTIAWIYRERVRALASPLIAGGVAGSGVAISWGLVAHSLGIFRLWDMSSAYAGGVGTRPELWRAAVVLWLRHPLLGVGAGNFEREIALTGLHGVRTHANSLYLQSLVEGGIPLFAATIFLVYTSIATFVRDRMRSPFVAAALAASIALALHQVVDFLTFYPKVGAEWWIVLALACAS